MSWFNLWDGLKTKTCRYLLQRYLGQFFENNLNLEQLKVDLYNGKAVVENISLKVNALNDLFEEQGWAFEVVSGHIGCLTVVVPWNALMTNDSSLEISNLVITVRPVIRKQNGTTMLESMWSSVSSSMQMAEECMKQDDDDVPFLIHNNALIGLDKFAETIDNVLNRIHAKLTNTTLNIEYILPNSSKKLVICFKADHMEYKNQTGYEKYTHTSNENTDCNNDEAQIPNFNTLPMIAKHNLILSGLAIHTTELICNDSYPPDFERIEQNLCKLVEFKGYQNILINIKQTENIIGPKVNLEVVIDEIYIMLSPRQIHLLVQMSCGFNKERPKDNMLKQCKNDKIHEPNETHNTKMTGIISKAGEWCAGIDCSDISEYSHRVEPFKKDVDSNKHQMSESNFTSASTNSMITSCSNTQREIVHAETSGEILKFKVQIALIMGIVLHDDVLIPNKSNDCEHPSLITDESYRNFCRLTNEFYLNINNEAQPDEFHLPIRNTNHLYFKVSPILINGNQDRHFHELSSKTSLSATMVDVCEILDNVKEHLLLFDRKQNCTEGYHRCPEIVISHSSSFSCKQNNNASRNKIDCVVEKCTLDFDISIIDRLSALLAESPFIDETNIIDTQSKNTNQLELHIQSDFLNLNMRFPVVDGRSPEDPEKMPWWKKNIRKDFLAFDFRNISIKLGAHICILADEINTFYCDGIMQNAIHLLNCLHQKDSTNVMNDNKRIFIEVQTLNDLSKVGLGTNQKSQSPFSSKCTYGYTSNIEGFQDESEAFLPGDTDELNQFCKSTMESSKLRIIVRIPVIKIVLESKPLYEIIYNRLNNDLFMWEPSSPLYKSDMSLQDDNDKNSIYRSYINNEDIDDGNPMNSKLMDRSIYLSLNESNAFREAPPKPKITKISKFVNACSFEIIIKEGELLLYAQVRDMESRVRPNQSGKFQCRLKDLKLFSVTGFNNDKNLGYFCIQLKELQVFHCGLITEDSPGAWTEGLDANMFPTLHNSPRSSDMSDARKELLSVVAEIKKQPNQRLKRVKVSFGINGATLRHNPTQPGQAWLNQLIDFLDVIDFPIEAYEPFALVSEIQVHAWSSAIDYRPKYFPYRAFINIGSCTLSSNIISSISGCKIKLIAEDWILNIGPINENAKGSTDIHTNLNCGILIPVLQIGLFNISLRLNEQNSTLYPKIDFRSSIHDIHLKTCYDSASALAQLITYVANDKDLKDTDENLVESEKFDDMTNVIFTNESGENYKDETQEHVNKLMAEALKDVEEIRASPRVKKISSDRKPVEVFYFPDDPDNKMLKSQSAQSLDKVSEICNILDFESNVMLQSYYQHKDSQSSHQVEMDLGNICTDKKNATDDNKDFCIIHEEEIAYMDQCGIKQISVSGDPLRIVDNHFTLPHEKVDLLRPPANFPVPESSYTLCEMTFTWHLFGGKDFPDKPSGLNFKENPRFTTVMSETYKYGVSHAYGESDKKSNKRNVNAADASASERNLEILVEVQFSKIRISFEIYPTNSMYSSRQVLLISEIEIRDRLRSSDINKLLYRPNSKSLNQKNDENMVIVKALHVRPDPQNSSAEECSLRISVLPIKVNIDQDTLLFLEEFFSSVAKSSKTEPTDTKSEVSTADRDRDTPVMSVNEIPEALQGFKVQKIVRENLDILIEDEMVNPAEPSAAAASTTDTPLTYFREVIFSPALPICLDYQGRRIEMSRGPIAGLLMGLAQLQGSGITLREIVNRRGLLGWNKLFAFLCKEWLKDIKRNQLPNILSGIGPTNAVLQLFHGVYDLFWLPIEQYNKDGRIIRGFQLGAQSFSARTALAALEITSRIIHLLQFTAETTFDMLSAGPSVKRRRQSKHGKKRRHGRPKDLREGVANAYTIVKEGINESANTLIEAAMTEHDQKGYTGAVGAVVRQIPQLVVCPAVLATQATTNILGGAKSSLVPEAKIEARDKWKHDNN